MLLRIYGPYGTLEMATASGNGVIQVDDLKLRCDPHALAEGELSYAIMSCHVVSCCCINFPIQKLGAKKLLRLLSRVSEIHDSLY
jgi:hypothetical protein